MTTHVNFSDLIEYTDWQREKWRVCLNSHGDVLNVAVGPNGDGRFAVVGDIVRQIFSAEKRYTERLSGRELTDASTIPNNRVEPLFQFGRQSRKELKDYVGLLPDREWDVPSEYNILKFSLRATPRKIVTHVLIHEIRHWAQVGTLLRLNGFPVELQDVLFAPVMDGRTPAS